MRWFITTLIALTSTIAALAAYSLLIGRLGHDLDWLDQTSTSLFHRYGTAIGSVFTLGAVATVIRLVYQFVTRNESAHLIDNIPELSIKRLGVSQSTQLDNIVSYFRAGSFWGAPTEIFSAQGLINRHTLTSLSDLGTDIPVIRVIGDPASGRTVLAWQAANALPARGKVYLATETTKLTPKTFETFFSRIRFVRFYSFDNYIIVIDNIDRLNTDLRSAAVEAINYGVKRELDYRSFFISSKLAWGRVYFVLVANSIAYSPTIERTISTRLLPEEEPEILEKIKNSLPARRAPTEITLNEVFLATGGRRSHEDDLSTFVANVLLFSGEAEALPEALNDGDLREVVDFIAAFTMLSLPIPLLLVPRLYHNRISKELSEGNGRLLISSSEPFEGVQLKLKPWSYALISAKGSTAEQFLLESYNNVFEAARTSLSLKRTTVEWLRHLLHRLHKRRHIGLTDFDGERIGRELVSRHLDTISCWLENARDAEELSLWAGTICSIRDENERVVHSALLCDIFRRVAAEGSSTLNHSPPAFISLAKAAQSIRLLNVDPETKKHCRAFAQEILDDINLKTIVAEDHKRNFGPNWRFRFGQTFESYIKWLNVVSGYSDSAARRTLNLIDSIDSEYHDLSCTLTPGLLLRKGKALIRIGELELGFKCIDEACDWSSNGLETRESATSHIEMLAERARYVCKYKPDDVTLAYRCYKGLFDQSGRCAHQISSVLLHQYYSDFIDFCERHSEAVSIYLGNEYFQSLATPLLKIPSDSGQWQRFRNVVDRLLDRRRFPISARSGDLMGTLIVELTTRLGDHMNIASNSDLLNNDLNEIAFGSGLQFVVRDGRLSCFRYDAAVTSDG